MKGIQLLFAIIFLFSLYVKGQVKSNDDSLLQVLQSAIIKEDMPATGYAYKYLALNKASLNQPLKAIQYYDSAYHCFQQIKDTSQMISVLNNVGRQLCSTGDFEKAIQGYHQALSWINKRKDQRKWLIVQFNHAACLSESFQHEATIALCEELLPIAKELGDWYISLELYSLQGINYGDLKKFKAAEQAYNQAFACIPKANSSNQDLGYDTSNPNATAYLLNNRALLYLEQKQFEKAYSDLKQSLQIITHSDSTHPNGEFYVNLGIATMGLQMWEESLNYFQEGLRRLKQANQLFLIGETYQHLSRLFKNTGEGVKAYMHLKMAHEIQDSLLSQMTKKNLQDLQLKYETEKFKKELADSKLKVAQQAHRLNLFKIGLLAFALIAGLGYYAYHSRQRGRMLTLEKRQVELQYGLLRAQMNPHFIFNALNSIQGFFVNHQFAQGNQFMGKFSTLIRQILDQSVLSRHPLSQELDTLRLYLDIEKERLGDNMNYHIEVAPNVEEDIIDLPPLIFQPFVENAIWHGIVPKNSKGQIWIDIKLNEAENLLISQIKDDGVGFDSQSFGKEKDYISKGISITRGRLENKGNIDIFSNEKQSGTTVQIELSLDK